MTSELKPRCCARVNSGGFFSSQCSKNAKFEREGKHYCAIHDPVARKAKNDKWLIDFNLKRDAQTKAWEEAALKKAQIERRAGCFDELLEALKNLSMYYEPKDASDSRAFDAAKSAIAKAVGVPS